MWFADKILLDRIKDLERTIEVLTGANGILERELEKSQSSERELKEKIFEFTGLTHTTSPIQKEINRDPIRLTKQVSWPNIRNTLEIKARENYWASKKKDQEASDGVTEKIDELEKAIHLQTNGDKDASQK